MASRAEGSSHPALEELGNSGQSCYDNRPSEHPFDPHGFDIHAQLAVRASSTQLGRPRVPAILVFSIFFESALFQNCPVPF